jgi:hypothetical protein
MSVGTHQQLAESDEKQLCICCMMPNEPSAHFCAECGAPLTSYASTGPFESLFAEGAVYREAAARPRRLIVVAGVWLVFGSAVFTGFAMVFGANFKLYNAPVAVTFFGAPGGIAMIAVSSAMIWKTTKNYLAWKHASRKRDDHDGLPCRGVPDERR